MKRRLAIAAALVLLAALSWNNYERDHAARVPIRRFLREYTVDKRRPVETEVLDYAPAADLATDAASLAALNDALGRVRLAGMAPGERALWLRSVERVPEELRDALELSVGAVRVRPGWPYHAFMTGRLAYILERRAGGTELDPRKWIEPLAIAMRRLPADNDVPVFLGGAILESWDDVPAGVRSEAPAVLRRAFADEEFVTRALSPAITSLGKDEALSLLPDKAAVLWRATSVLSKLQDVPLVAATYARWRRVEWRERSRDLLDLEQRYGAGDSGNLAYACRAWVAAHRIRDYDDTAGRSQVARLLELWPEDDSGVWSSDPRADIVRFFLDGREATVDRKALARAVDALSGVPEVVMATARLFDGDHYEAQRMMVASETDRSFEWTPLIVRLVDDRVKHRDLDGAREALAHLAPGASDECDVLLARRELLAAEGRVDPELESTIDAVSPSTIPADAFSRDGSLSLCVDPARFGGAQLKVQYDAAAAAFVTWGWGGGTSAFGIVNPADAEVALPLRGVRGRKFFTKSVLSGSRPEVTGAHME